MRAIVVAAAAALGGAFACAATAFVCSDDVDCTNGSIDGVCEATGACSFPDDACPSGRRYGARGHDGLAGSCVGDDDTSSSSGSATTSTTVTGLDTTLRTDGDGSDTATTDGPAESSESGVPSCPPGWWDCAWTRRVPLVIAATGSETLVDVPILLLLGGARIDAEAVRSDGADVRIVDASGVVVPHEIETWDPAGVSAVWIAVRELRADRELALALYHGNPNATDVQDADGVWADPYVGVWHLSSTDDSSGNGNHGITGGDVLPAGGWVGDAREFFDVGDRIEVAPSPVLDEVFFAGGTISAWARADTFGGTNRGRIADNAEGGSGGWMFYLAGDGGGSLRFRHGYEGEQTIWASPSRVVGVDHWHHVAVTFATEDGAAPRMFVDGVELESTADLEPTTPPVSDAGNALLIGDSEVTDRWFDGRIDELRLERTRRSPAWLTVQLQSMRDELVDYGAIERIEVVP